MQREGVLANVQADAVAFEAARKLALPGGIARAAEQGHRLGAMLLRRYAASDKALVGHYGADGVAPRQARPRRSAAARLLYI